LTAKKPDSNRAPTVFSSTLLTEERTAYLTEHWPAGTPRDLIFVALNKMDGLPIAKERISSLAMRLGLHRPEVMDANANGPMPIASVEDLGAPVSMTWDEAIKYAERLGVRFRDDVPYEEAILVINDRRIRDGVPPFEIIDHKTPAPRPQTGAPTRKRLLALN